jgi:predicted ATP-dependent serine protease
MQHTTILPPLPNASTVRQQNYAVLPLPAPYDALLGKLPRTAQFSLLLYGENGTGKSTLSLRLAELFARITNKRVLYNGNEEPVETGTLKLRLDMLGIHDRRIDFLDSKIFADLEAYLKSGQYAYAFVDSVNNYDVPDTRVLQLQYDFPAISFVFLSQMNKSGQSRASETLKHLVSAVYRTQKDTEAGVRSVHLEKSRYGATMREMVIFQG